MAINKFIKKLLGEIILCFTIAILAGHITTSFWERYLIQKELYNMKDNLRRLNVTVNYIGNAYDNLHNELIGLAGSKQPKQPRHNVKFSNQPQDGTTAKTLQYEIIKEIDNEKNRKPIVQREMGIMSNSYNAINNSESRNVSTFTNNPSKTTAVGGESEGLYCRDSKSKYSCKLKNSHESQENCKTCVCRYK